MADLYRALINKGWLSACCCVCGGQSVPLSFDHGISVWPTPMDLLRGPDRTREVVEKFAKIGWLIEHQKATCPQCRSDKDAPQKALAAPGFD